MWPFRKKEKVKWRAFVHNRETGERWVEDFDTWEEVIDYIQRLARECNCPIYGMADIYDIGPYRVDVVKFRGGEDEWLS